MSEESKTNSLLRRLPSVESVLKTETARAFSESAGLKRVTETARAAIEDLRVQLVSGETDNELSRERLLELAEKQLAEKIENLNRQKFQRVINATGVIIHTNLGRAPLAEAAKKAILETASGYCTLEYDLETGERGRRGRAAEELLCELTGAEAALIVNNCAAAAFLVLSEFGKGGEAVVSRGELVEIGGDFRVPDVMAQSGTRLVEVGTTNRTKLRDFEQAINENTKLLVRVHPSNFRIIGFTAMPSLSELAKLARERDLILYEDAGSGALVDLSRYGLSDEPVISESIRAGADVVTFSGDKLLGGVQAGIVVGRERIIERLRKNPLYRALRVDKIVYASLSATLEIYRNEKHLAEIPVLRMLSQTKEEIRDRVGQFCSEFKVQVSSMENQNSEPGTLNLELAEGFSAIGGGSAPLARLETVLISLQHERLSAKELENALRKSAPPIICRIAEDKVLLDLRTVFESEEMEIAAALLRILKQTDFFQG
ncbi:MAG: L-seryl-tRNA(Sec) selenium transferase [Acidobacteriota bacterium]|nr:L-seryl-tRNA(Sec) selenium transferase [Acidobacteriota bacterium]